jgi:hypothetical protein
LSADLTFDPSEWATLGEAAEILRWKFDSSDEPQWRLLGLLQQRPSMACVVTATLPSLRNNELRAGLTPLPDRCQWASIDEIDWSASKVRASPLLSETQWQSWCPSDHMLDVRVRRTEVLAAVEEERAASERRIAKRREVAAKLFGKNRPASGLPPPTRSPRLRRAPQGIGLIGGMGPTARSLQHL